jgi:hypothetical protein
VTALLPAIPTGLKQSTTTLDGLGKLLGMMGQQQDLREMYDDPETAFDPRALLPETMRFVISRLARGKPRCRRSGAEAPGRQLGYSEEAIAGTRRTLLSE